MREVAVAAFLLVVIVACSLVLRAVHLDNSKPHPIKSQIGTPLHVCAPDVKPC